MDFRKAIATVGIALFDRGVWRLGLGSAAIAEVARFAFEKLRLVRLRAGIVEANVGSIRTFEKVGFRRSGSKDPDPEHGPAGWWILDGSGKASPDSRNR